jgi:hypothetical protein
MVIAQLARCGVVHDGTFFASFVQLWNISDHFSHVPFSFRRVAIQSLMFRYSNYSGTLEYAKRVGTEPATTETESTFTESDVDIFGNAKRNSEIAHLMPKSVHGAYYWKSIIPCVLPGVEDEG